MYDGPGGTDLGPAVDVAIAFPADGIVRIESLRLFADADSELCRRFIGSAFLAPQIDGAVIGPSSREGIAAAIDLHFDPAHCDRAELLT